MRLLRIIVIAATVLLFGVSLLILISSRSTLEIYLSDEWQAGDCVPDSDIVEISEIDDKANKIFVVANVKNGTGRVDIYDRNSDQFVASLKILLGGIVCNLGNSDFSGCRPISVSFLVYLAAVFVICLISFVIRCKNDLFSYTTLYYGGITLFMLHVLLSIAPYVLRVFTAPAEFDMLNVFSLIRYSGEDFIMKTIPVLLVFAACLAVSNISLIRHEGKRLVNILGLILSGLLVGGYLFYNLLTSFFNHGSVQQMKVYGAFLSVFSTTIVYFEMMLASAVICGFIAAKKKPAYDKTHVIILGCAISDDGTPLPLLRGRIDRAIAFAREQKEKTGKDIVFVPSGGKGSDEIISESESMGNYLVSKGISRENIILEDKSVNTVQNMQFSLEKIKEQCEEPNIIFATNEYHVLRSGMISRTAGLDAEGIGSKTKWYFWPNAFVREFIGLLASKWKRHALLVAAFIVFFVTVNIFLPM